MKNIHIVMSLSVILLSALILSVSAQQFNYSHMSTVVIDTTPERTAEVVKNLLANNQISLEYDCKVSGVIVVKVKHNFSSVGDVKTFVNRSMGQGKNAIIIFCDLHGILAEGKC